ncbi:hypothetical protein AA700_1668 [Acidiphilium acidophilum DSM 700]|nr:hypothetical protein AA700_1668 [Acidiphilium acidophilum DSM 700]
MLRQYFASPFMGGTNPLRVGTIAIGNTYYLQDDGWWRDRYRGKPVFRNPWIVEAFLNGVCAASRKNPTTGRWDDVYLTGRSDRAVIRSLRTGQRRTVAVRTLHLADEQGHHKTWPAYPDQPAPHLIERYLSRNGKASLASTRRAA